MIVNLIKIVLALDNQEALLYIDGEVGCGLWDHLWLDR